jgi:glycosyltransferase involved in cell wall biosynthesis
MLKKGIKSGKIKVIYNGIDTDRFHKIYDNDKLKILYNFPLNSKVVGTVGSLTIEKGHTYFIEAANKVLKLYPDINFLIVGDGRCRNELEEKVNSLGIGKNVIFTGLRSDMPAIYSLMDVFVLPSLVEGMPMVLLEAMASGTPVIATSVGSVPKAVIDNQTGILVSPRDVDGLAKAMQFLIRNEEAARAYGGNGLKMAENEFVSNIMCKKYLDTYNKLLNRDHEQS